LEISDKIFHSHIGVVTGCFPDATTGQYAKSAKTDPMHTESTIKTWKRQLKKLVKRVNEQTMTHNKMHQCTANAE